MAPTGFDSSEGASFPQETLQNLRNLGANRCQTVGPLTATVSMAVISESHPVAVPSNFFLNSLTERVGYPSGGTCRTGATDTANINNDEDSHGDCSRVRTIITSVQSTLEVFGSIYWGPCIVLSEPYKLAVNKLVSPSMGKVK
jgi:hypothetical protein